ncbi:hypothetical protein RO1_13010 [Roseburia intestinalis XB6B4]|uniref:Uncharacterized protein n=1 Tax=Roseburia intestinalis XB6B4 TaxID=718255 RepID=D4KX42_9FIRM|nr:hypothetical protein RO1_13010 [Roseburia intestinalis XB6B4]
MSLSHGYESSVILAFLFAYWFYCKTFSQICQNNIRTLQKKFPDRQEFLSAGDFLWHKFI